MITLGIGTFICIIGGTFIIGGVVGLISYSLSNSWKR